MTELRSETHVDVIIVGAGLSGIGAARHLKTTCPDRSFMILEGRETIGGTWDLFRYPGIRSDSDMYTLGYSFRPWTEAKAIADGLVPEMARTASHVTMLQRSPTYIVGRPGEDAQALKLRRLLPEKMAYGLIRWRNVLMGMVFYRLARRRPDRVKTAIIDQVRQTLGPDFDIETHFSPRYNPWDQRLCLAPDGDFFQALKAGSASVVTDEIESFTETGLKLKSGAELAADIIITATGLKLEPMNGLVLSVDGAPVRPAETLSYKGMMYSNVPNLASAFGYTNASWTLKCDLTCEYVCRLLNHMRRKGLRQCTPGLDHLPSETAPWLDFTSGYVQRSMGGFPKQGVTAPWKLHQNYAPDLASLRFSGLEDGVMRFSNPIPRLRKAALILLRPDRRFPPVGT